MGALSGQSPTRRRDAASTRHDLLEAAATLFAERGFERTTVRDIAVRAGVNQALLFRYFGSKDALFEEVTAWRGRELLAATAAERLLEDSLRGMLTSDRPAEPYRALEAVLRSIGTDSAAAPRSRCLGDEYARTLAMLTHHDNAGLRADLVLAWLVGIGMLRGVPDRRALANADADEVCSLVLPAVRTLLEHIAPGTDHAGPGRS